MTKQYIQSETIGKVLLLTMHDPDTRNAIGEEMAGQLEEELDRFEFSSNLRTVVLTGSNPSFCSGANVKSWDKDNKSTQREPIPEDRSPWDLLNEAWEKQSLIPGRPKDFIDPVRLIPVRLHNLQNPSIAAVNGPAMGLGCGIALSCDIRYASENAKFSEMFVKRGLIPADGSCWQLPRMIGLSRTLLLQYTGDILDAQTAFELGIVNEVCEQNQILESSMELAEKISNGATYGMSLIKKLVHESQFIDFETSIKLAGPAQEIARRTQDHQEGVTSFIEKRKPNFIGK